MIVSGKAALSRALSASPRDPKLHSGARLPCAQTPDMVPRQSQAAKGPASRQRQGHRALANERRDTSPLPLILGVAGAGDRACSCHPATTKGKPGKSQRPAQHPSSRNCRLPDAPSIASGSPSVFLFPATLQGPNQLQRTLDCSPNQGEGRGRQKTKDQSPGHAALSVREGKVQPTMGPSRLQVLGQTC